MPLGGHGSDLSHRLRDRGALRALARTRGLGRRRACCAHDRVSGCAGATPGCSTSASTRGAGAAAGCGGRPTASAARVLAQAARELVRRDGPRLRRLAQRRNHQRPCARAARADARRLADSRSTCCAPRYANGTPEVRAAVVAIARSRTGPRPTTCSLDILVTGAAPALADRDRTDAARAAARPGARDRLTGDHEPEVRYWALMLLRDVARRRPREGSGGRSFRRLRRHRPCRRRPRARGERAHRMSSTCSAHSSPTRCSSSARTPRVQSARSAPSRSPTTSPRSSPTRTGGCAPRRRRACSCSARAACARRPQMLQNVDGFARDGAREVVSAFRRESRPLELAG